MAKKKSAKPPGRRPKDELVPKGYEAFLVELKERIRTAQLRAAIAVNRELVLLYWQTGRDILLRQKEHGWGSKVIDRLSADLRRPFPGVEGFSPRNLKYMRAFAEAWPEESIVQEALAQITWYHAVTDPAGFILNVVIASIEPGQILLYELAIGEANLVDVRGVSVDQI